jgi:hypothetical protein
LNGADHARENQFHTRHAGHPHGGATNLAGRFDKLRTGMARSYNSYLMICLAQWLK